ncbi:proteinaceous RNase P 1, chloroplastic/mitochondrial-like [Trifolium pratense]|uniref:proteinaceous RNase P 1, chloroplastic/mitochondrial-like n=1 Tax=Trifolium pratense TaxID=57577 RepID=UPI001E697054|nr:proteinaceous RNase P 1, chloroplastic/mitochondrial-like [Trifolium pratense]
MATSSPLTLQLQQSFCFSHSLRHTLLSNYDYESFPSTTTTRKLTAIQCSSHNSPVETTTKNSVRRVSNKTTSPSSSHTDKRVSLESKSVNSTTSYKVVEKKKNNENETKNVVEKKNTNTKKKKIKDTPQVKLQYSLDMCSKRGDLKGALSLYDSTISQGVKLSQRHYTVLLYLCSSAAIGVLQPAKSGSRTRTLNAQVAVDINDNDDDDDDRYGSDNNDNTLLDNSVSVSHSDDDSDNDMDKDKRNAILVSEDVKKHALQRGFEVYENMCLNKVEMNEAALTSVARMAMAMGDGDMAFEMVKQMKILGINPRLRSYGPALSTYCNNKEIDKAFDVENHMLEHGVYPEEPELEALLRVSMRAGKSDRVYYVLHKLRSSVRKVSTFTADLILDWFKSKMASRVGRRKWDKGLIMEAMENNGGGWHGIGWLGKGKWQVLHTSVGNDGMCKCCGVQLATIDLDPVETENFAKSVASIAISKEKNSNFQTFQKWLDYYGPFEAVIDAANVGLFSQGKFMPSKINAVVNEMRHKLPSKKFPLIVLHHRRIKGDKRDGPINKALVDRWNNAAALYATPTGSNDDWYWLYAAIKFKCLLVTNDEMRDHLFQLLGNDFFPKWKERHQVRFGFSDAGLGFYMPPPCSVVIQESEEGHWHIPIEAELNDEADRRWLCITRAKLDMVSKDSSTTFKDEKPRKNGARADSVARNESAKELQYQTIVNHKDMKETSQQLYKNLRS